jgi:REP element-mobilizing transposase RayT
LRVALCGIIIPDMRIVDPHTGRARLEKRRQRFNIPRQPRELTFSCYRRLPFLLRPRVREWFREALEAARAKFGFQLWAYVLMPEHAHLLIYAGEAPEQMSRFLRALKEPVARKAVAFLQANDPAWLARLTVREGQAAQPHLAARRWLRPRHRADRDTAIDDGIPARQSRAPRAGRQGREL